MGDPQNDQSKAAQVETVDSSEESIDSQLVQLAQAKLDGKINQETYDHLVGLLKDWRPRKEWDSSESIEYATPQQQSSRNQWFFWSLFAILLLFLAGILIPNIFAPRTFSANRQAGAHTAAITDIANFETAVDAFETDAGRYPTSAEGLAALLQPPAKLISPWRGPYVRIVAPDPWGHAYIYQAPGIHHQKGFDLSSAGPDGKAGTPDDITNW